MMKLPKVHYGLQGKLAVSVVERGEVIKTFPEVKNLILNQGLDLVASQQFGACFDHAVAGTGSTATELDGGAETATIAAGVVTISNIGFLAGDASDVGRTIKLTSSGNNYRITSQISSTQCNVTPADSIGPDNFFIYNTNQTGLTAEVKRTTTYLTGAPDCQTVTVGAVTTMTRTFDFSAEGGPITYNEVGFSNLNAAGSNLFSRVKLPAGVPLLTGQQLRLKYSLAITVSPITPLTIGTSPIIGWASATGTLVNVMIPIGFVNTSGNTLSSGSVFGQNPVDGKYYWAGDPSQTTGSLVLSTENSAHGSYGSLTTDGGSTTKATLTEGLSSYISGTYTRDRFATYAVGNANRTDWGCFYQGFLAVSNSYYTLARYLFDTAQTKLSTHTLTLGWRSTWGRIL